MPEYTLHSLFDPDSMCSDPRNFVDTLTKDGRMIRTTCKVCGSFVGYRPAEVVKKTRKRVGKTTKMLAAM